jgi:hypothetical protein
MMTQTQSEASKLYQSLFSCNLTLIIQFLDGNPYWQWIENYAAEDFQDSVAENKGEEWCLQDTSLNNWLNLDLISLAGKTCFAPHIHIRHQVARSL